MSNARCVPQKNPAMILPLRGLSSPVMNRRTFIESVPAGVAAAAALAGLGRGASASAQGSSATTAPSGTPGGFKHSVCRWCYGSMDLRELARAAKGMGISSIELLTEPEWKIVQEEGLTCAVANGPTSIGPGFNHPDKHDAIIKSAETLLPKIRAAGLPMMIVFSGNRGGVSDEVGMQNSVTALKRMMPLAEAANITVVMELFNSKVDHKDYLADRTHWGVELVKRVGSDRFRLLYDIYHMQIMEGDVIRTIQDNHWAINHYHTGGVPGRAEIDSTQELNYPAICRAINATGFTGFVAQEFIPRSGDPMKSLAESIKICTV